MELVERVIPQESIILRPVSDLQVGAPGCDLERFKRWFDEGLQLGAYFYGVGDYVDDASPSGRKKIRNADFYDSTVNDLEESAMRRYEEVRDLFKQAGDHWLFLLGGHHYYQFEDGRMTDIMLAEALGCPFLGTSTVFQLNLQRQAHSAQHCQVFAHHGERAFKRPDLGLAYIERDIAPAWPTVDIFTIAHSHLAATQKVELMVPKYGKHPAIKGKQRLYSLSGAWMKGYVVGNQRGGRPSGTYVEQQLLRPNSIGGVTIRVESVHTGNFDYLEISGTTD